MIHLAIDTDPRPLPFYLAMEEVAARRYAGCGDVIFTWQVEPTVICGRHQDVAAEVDLDYCRRRGIDVVRRRSGGGAVFANLSNVMISYVCRDDDTVEAVFGRYTRRMAALLRTLGVAAEAGARNDVTIGGRKVSGGAFYRIPGAYIAHSTMLIDTDRSEMARALTPSRAKLESKGVKSVASRVTTLREHLPEVTPGEFRRSVASICDSEIVATGSDIAAAETLARAYRSRGWFEGGRRGSRHARIDGVGEIWADVAVTDGVIESVELVGDFFDISDIDALCSRLRGVGHSVREVAAAIGDSPVAGLTAVQLADVIVK